MEGKAMRPPLKSANPFDFQTPPYALDPLLPYLPKDWRIWECACGKGNLVSALAGHGYDVVGTDLLTGDDYLMWQPDRWDVVVTNPPYDYKKYFLERAYSLGKPFAFLLPLTTFETRRRQELFRAHGVEVIFMPDRVNFEREGVGLHSWFCTAWFTWGLHLPSQMVFWEGKP
jgi:hypothetical protein